MTDKNAPLHKRYAETGEVPGIEPIEPAFKSVPDGDQAAGRRGLADHQRGMTKRGKDANHGEY